MNPCIQDDVQVTMDVNEIDEVKEEPVESTTDITDLDSNEVETVQTLDEAIEEETAMEITAEEPPKKESSETKETLEKPAEEMEVEVKEENVSDEVNQSDIQVPVLADSLAEGMKHYNFFIVNEKYLKLLRSNKAKRL